MNEVDRVMIFLTADWCGWYNDSILCWPPTAPGHLATIPCSLISDLGSPCHPGLARLQCQPGGDWSRATNYTECLANINLVRQADSEPRTLTETQTGAAMTTQPKAQNPQNGVILLELCCYGQTEHQSEQSISVDVDQ